MQNNLLLGVSIGESFAEFSLKCDNEFKAQKRVYLARESLKSSLQQFLAPFKSQELSAAFVAIRIPKKLLDYRLSGSAALIASAGLAQWLEVCGNPDYKLTDKELQFSINERILVDGTIEQPLQIEELQQISEKLKTAGCKKVCLNFLHSNKYPIHRDLAEKFLTESGFEVFVPEKTENLYEVSRWTKNALNATLSGVLSEIRSDLFTGVSGFISPEKVYFLDGAGNLTQDQKNKEVSGQFAASTAIGLADHASDSDILHLGLEQFTLISPSVTETYWKSLWGPVEVSHIKTHSLGIQPTLGIDLNKFNRFDFSTTEHHWEPGPMFLGRGQKMTMLDIWSDNAKLAKIDGLEERISAQGIQRFKTALLALSKISTFTDNDFGHLMKEMQSLSVQRIAMESRLRRQTKKLIVTGPLAPLFSNIFKKDPHTKVLVNEFSESNALIEVGVRKLKEMA